MDSTLEARILRRYAEARAGKAKRKCPPVEQRQGYQRGTICRSENGQIWYGKYYPAPGAPQKGIQLCRTDEMDDTQARIAMDDIVATLNKNPAHALGAELVRRFVEQVYIPQKYEDGASRDNTGREAEYLFRQSVLPVIGELRCRDLKTDHIRDVLRKLASAGLSYESQGQVRDGRHGPEDDRGAVRDVQHCGRAEDAEDSAEV